MTQITIQDADLAALIQAATATLAKIDTAADALTQAIPLIQSDVREAADAVKAAQVNVNDALAALQLDAGRIATAAENFSVFKH
jgi:hypothetical protein